MPIIEPGATVLGAYNAGTAAPGRIPTRLLALLDEGRIEWRAELKIPTAQRISAEKSACGLVTASAPPSQLQPTAVQAKSLSKQYRFVELFAGIGGFRLGLDLAGRYECVFASEIEKKARGIYATNFERCKSVEHDQDTLNNQSCSIRRLISNM